MPVKKKRPPRKDQGQKREGSGTELSPWKGNGGQRKGAGRPVGSRNAAPLVDRMRLAELCRQHTERAINDLYAIAIGKTKGTSVRDRLSAWEMLLDRGFGRAPQGQPIPEAPSGIVGLTITQEMLDKLSDKQQAQLETILLILAGDDSVSASRTDASQVGEERFATTIGHS